MTHVVQRRHHEGHRKGTSTRHTPCYSKEYANVFHSLPTVCPPPGQGVGLCQVLVSGQGVGHVKPSPVPYITRGYSMHALKLLLAWLYTGVPLWLGKLHSKRD